MLLAISFSSCDLINDSQEDEKGAPIASYKDVKLYWEDARGYIPAFNSREDSSFKVGNYISTWVSRQESLENAKKDSAIDFDRINKKLIKLKEDLILHEYHSNYVETHLNTSISDKEILDYYEKNKALFILQEPIIKGLFIKITNESKNLWEIGNLSGKEDSTSKARLNELVEKEATNYDLDRNSWKKLSDYLIRTPYYQSEREINRLKRNKNIRLEKNGFVYFIRIFEYLDIQEIAPVEIKRSTIKHIILNNRKQELIKKLNTSSVKSS